MSIDDRRGLLAPLCGEGAWIAASVAMTGDRYSTHPVYAVYPCGYLSFVVHVACAGVGQDEAGVDAAEAEGVAQRVVRRAV